MVFLNFFCGHIKVKIALNMRVAVVPGYVDMIPVAVDFNAVPHMSGVGALAVFTVKLRAVAVNTHALHTEAVADYLKSL